MAPASGGSGMMTSSPTSAMSLAMRKGGGGGESGESGGGGDQGDGLESLRRSLFVRSLSSHPSSSLRSGVVVLQVACGMHHVVVRDRHGACFLVLFLFLYSFLFSPQKRICSFSQFTLDFDFSFYCWRHFFVISKNIKMLLTSVFFLFCFV